MDYWILQHNPAILKNNPNRPPGIPDNFDYWRIRWYEKQVNIDDLAFIWIAGPKRGIYNVAKIISVEPHNPQAQRYIDLMWISDYPYYDSDAVTRLGQYPSILIERWYSNDFQQPLSIDELRSEGFDNLPVIQRPWSGGIFPLEQIVGERLLEHIRRTRGRRQ